MATTEVFNRANVETKITTLGQKFTNLATKFDEVTTLLTENLTSPDNALYGMAADKILKTWEENSASLKDFVDIFENWSAMVVSIGANYATFEGDTVTVSGLDEINKAAWANRTTAFMTTAGATAMAATTENNSQNITDENGFSYIQSKELVDGKYVTKKDYGDYYSISKYNPETGTYETFYYVKNEDGEDKQIDEQEFNSLVFASTYVGSKITSEMVDSSWRENYFSLDKSERESILELYDENTNESGVYRDADGNIVVVKVDENGDIIKEIYNEEGKISAEIIEKYDENGLDPEGYNIEGYDAEGYNREGFNKEGYNREGYDAEGYDAKGYDAEGYDREGFDKEGFSRAGYTREGYDAEGYDEKGYDAKGYDREGYDEKGYDKNGWNEDGLNKVTGTKYDEMGYDKEGYDANGWNEEGLNKETGTKYDKTGYDKEGYDANGWTENGLNKETGTKYDKTGYDKEGYDANGYNTEGYDDYGNPQVSYQLSGSTANEVLASSKELEKQLSAENEYLGNRLSDLEVAKNSLDANKDNYTAEEYANLSEQYQAKIDETSSQIEIRETIISELSDANVDNVGWNDGVLKDAAEVSGDSYSTTAEENKISLNNTISEQNLKSLTEICNSDGDNYQSRYGPLISSYTDTDSEAYGSYAKVWDSLPTENTVSDLTLEAAYKSAKGSNSVVTSEINSDIVYFNTRDDFFKTGFSSSECDSLLMADSSDFVELGGKSYDSVYDVKNDKYYTVAEWNKMNSNN